MAQSKLQPLSDWSRERFTRPPTRNTLMKMIDLGDIPAKKMGGRWFVLVDKEANSTNDPLVDSVLQEK